MAGRKKSLERVRAYAVKARSAHAEGAGTQKTFAARALRDQAIRSARSDGIRAIQIAEAAGLSLSRTGAIIREGPFGRKRGPRDPGVN